jgi:hypothetical protein
MPLMVTFTTLKGTWQRIDLDTCEWHPLFRLLRPENPPPGWTPFPPPEVRWIFETRDRPPRWILSFRASIPTGAITTDDGRYTPAVPRPSPDWPYHEISREQAIAIMDGCEYPRPVSLTEATPADPSPSGTAARPPEGNRPGPPDASESQAGKPTLTPLARVLAAAADLKREGKRISLRAACDRARADRTNLRKNYPEAVEALRRIATPDRTPRRGTRNRRTGDIDPTDDSED